MWRKNVYGDRKWLQVSREEQLRWTLLCVFPPASFSFTIHSLVFLSSSRLTFFLLFYLSPLLSSSRFPYSFPPLSDLPPFFPMPSCLPLLCSCLLSYFLPLLSSSWSFLSSCAVLFSVPSFVYYFSLLSSSLLFSFSSFIFLVPSLIFLRCSMFFSSLVFRSIFSV